MWEHTMKNASPPWLDRARQELGTHEGPGAKNNPAVMAYFRDSRAGAGVSGDATPWCAAFVSAMLERCGIKSARTLSSVAYLRWGRELPKHSPLPGAIVILRRGANPAFGHIAFFVRKLPDGRWLLLGGNQSDAVTEAVFDPEAVRGVRWPILQGVPVAVDPPKPRPAPARPAPVAAPVAAPAPVVAPVAMSAPVVAPVPVAVPVPTPPAPAPAFVPVPVAVAPTDAEIEAALRERQSRTITGADQAEKWTVRGVLSMIGLGGGTKVLEWLKDFGGVYDDWRPAIDGAHDAMRWAWDFYWLIAPVFMVAVLVALWRIKDARIDDHRTGTNTGRQGNAQPST